MAYEVGLQHNLLKILKEHLYEKKTSSFQKHLEAAQYNHSLTCWPFSSCIRAIGSYMPQGYLDDDTERNKAASNITVCLVHQSKAH